MSIPMRPIMTKTFSLLAPFLLGLASPAAHAEDLIARFSLGLGYRICQTQSPPIPLDRAFFCPGMEPSLEKVEVVLKELETATPEKKYWEGRLVREDSVEGIPLKVELVVTYAYVSGRKYFFIDGELVSGIPDRRSLIRLAVEGELGLKQTTTLYGMASPLPDTDPGLEVIPLLYLAQ